MGTREDDPVPVSVSVAAVVVGGVMGALGEVGELLDAEVTFRIPDPAKDDGNLTNPPNPWGSAAGPSELSMADAPSIPVP